MMALMPTISIMILRVIGEIGDEIDHHDKCCTFIESIYLALFICVAFEVEKWASERLLDNKL